MNTRTFPLQGTARSAMPASARRVLRLLSRLRHGALQMHLPDGSVQAHGSGSPCATIHIHSWRVFERAMKSGDIGFAEAYIDGDWETPDLSALLVVLIANRDEIEKLFYGSWWGSLFYRIKHALNRNSRSGSAKNIHAHYDLGNHFYALWLDPSMSYSSALFSGGHAQSLTSAQDAKTRRALQEIALAPGQHVLEIGCGWGALAEMAARDFGARVTGVTLSSEQLAWARDRLARAGLSDKADLRLQDYRDLGTVASKDCALYDGVVSIEMFEAVGREYWPAYFDTLARCLKPGGLACIQTITIRDDLFERYVHSTDFIQQYIFPGGLLPSISQFEAMATRAGFALERRHAFGPDYAETLRRWQDAFRSREAQVRELGFDTRFIRIWQFYLSYCEAAFDLGNTDVVQFTLRRLAPVA